MKVLDPSIRPGLALIRHTLLGYRWEAARAISGALLWTATVVSIPLMTRHIIDRSILADRGSVLGGLVLGLLGLGLLQGIGIGVRRYFGFRLSYRAEADLRNRMFEQVQRLSFRFHDEASTGQLMARASSDLSQMRLVLAMTPITVANIGMFLAVIAVFIVLDPILGLVASLTVPILGLGARSYARRVIKLSFDVQQRLADLSEVVEEAIGGIQVTKSHGQEDQERGKLDHAADRILDDSISLARIRSVFTPLFELIPSLGTVAVLWLGGIRVVNGQVSLGEFVAFTQYLGVLMFPLRITGWFFAQVPRAAAAGTRISQLFSEAPDIADPHQPLELQRGPGEVRFTGVSFAYPDGTGVLSDIDLTIPGGTSVALVGATGAGKTTLSFLIPRFYDVDRGAVAIDGVDVRRIRLSELRREIALVFQETFLFSASVRDNIAFGRADATDEQVRLAARLAQAHDFIMDLPDAYDTVVGERGHSLSGGQRQRVALARAVLRDPRVLILDDATSSVDAIVEAEMLAALERVMAGRTTVIIAHRTSTLALVDRVVFLDDGGIAAVGTHDELLRTVARYAEVLAQEESLR
ncbi:MAG: ABC transporter ATP-binding protein/permease [Acidimicrobiia bacterium]|nr:ABC transporter ATP-binding protein/permease [Acidimicrobiia bacterium]